jgi:hypothetical protein
MTALVKHKIIVCLSLYNWTKQQVIVKIFEIPDLTKQSFQNPDSVILWLRTVEVKLLHCYSSALLLGVLVRPSVCLIWSWSSLLFLLFLLLICLSIVWWWPVVNPRPSTRRTANGNREHNCSLCSSVPTQTASIQGGGAPRNKTWFICLASCHELGQQYTHTHTYTHTDMWHGHFPSYLVTARRNRASVRNGGKTHFWEDIWRQKSELGTACSSPWAQDLIVSCPEPYYLKIRKVFLT